jgi:hypothetical protein
MTTTTDLTGMRDGLTAFRDHARASVLQSMDALEADLRDLANLIARRHEAAEKRRATGDNTAHISGRGGLLIVEVDEIMRRLSGINAADLVRNARDYAVAAGQVEVLPEQDAADHGSLVPSRSDVAMQESGPLTEVKLSDAQVEMLRSFVGAEDAGPQRIWYGGKTQDALVRRGLVRRIDVDGTDPWPIELTDAGREVLLRLLQEG